MNFLGVGVLRPQRLQQLDELLAGDVLLGQPQVHVVVVVGAVGPEDVQPLAAVAHAHVEPLARQQPAGIQQVHAPDRVAGVHEIPPGPRPRLTLVPPVLPHELLLLLDVGLPEEAGDLVVAGPDPAEQVLDARDRVGHAEGRLDPGADLLGVVEHALGDLLLEPLDLGRARGGPDRPGSAGCRVRSSPLLRKMRSHCPTWRVETPSNSAISSRVRPSSLQSTAESRW